MNRESFLEALNSGQFPLTWFKDFYERYSDKIWNENLFFTWVNSSPFNNVNSLLQEVLIPFYKKEFNIIELLSKDKTVIKIY